MTPEQQRIEQILKMMGTSSITPRQAQFLMGQPAGKGWLDELAEPEKAENMHGSRQVCPECRAVGPIIITCAHANKIWVGPKWRAPKKTNDRAWKRIAEGDILWDHSAIEAVARRDAARSASAAELMRKNKLTRSAAMRQARYNIKTS